MKARVNIAAVHYHFRSKEALLEAVVLRRAEPANKERLALLETYERTECNGHLQVEGVIRAFLAPQIAVARDPARGGAVFTRLLGRLHGEGDLLAKILVGHFMQVLERFGAALRQALPDLPPEELLWRVHFSLGAVAQALRGGQGLELLSGGLCSTTDAELTLERLVKFVSAGLRTPVADCRGSGGSK